jgi:hypothetical protein
VIALCYTFTVTVSVSASAEIAIFGSVSATVSGSITKSTSTKSQSSYKVNVPKGRTKYIADLLHHYWIFGHLYYVTENCKNTHSRYINVKAYKPFTWDWRYNKPFNSY